MQRKSFKQHLVRSLDAHNLSNARLSQLRKLEHNAKDAVPQETGYENRSRISLIAQEFWKPAIAACLALMISLVYFTRPGDLVETISNEVATNHLHLKPLDIEATDLAVIRAGLTELNFKPVTSSHFQTASARLLGGRYCSIRGKLAVQLRYQADGGRSITLYETSYDPNKFAGLPNVDKGQQPIERFSKGMRIRIWIEKGLVFASVNE